MFYLKIFFGFFKIFQLQNFLNYSPFLKNLECYKFSGMAIIDFCYKQYKLLSISGLFSAK